MDIKKNNMYLLGLEHSGCNPADYYLLKDSILNIHGREIIHAIFTYGMPSVYLNYGYTKKRYKEIMYKKFMIESVLDEERGYLMQNALFDLLDPTEKTNISYYYGMIFTKLISRKVFDVPILIHLSLFEKLYKGAITYTGATKIRPDLIGYNSVTDKWSVWEAKGNKAGLNKALNQLDVINTINKKKPDLKVACAAYFDKYLKVKVIDPVDSGEVNIIIDTNKMYEFYYRAIFELIEGNNTKTENGIISSNINLFNTRIDIGLPVEIFNCIYGQKSNELSKIVPNCKEMYINEKNMFSDLVYLK